MEELIFALIGFVSGIAAGFFGMGGGTIIVPCLLYMGYGIEYAIGISIMQMVFSSTFGSIINFWRKNLDIKIGVYVGIGGLFGASFSGLIVSSLPSQILLLLFILLTLVGLKKYIFNTKTTANPNPPITNPLHQKFVLIGVGALTGVFAISLGIGGGLMIAPMLAYFLGLDSKKVVPIALFFVIFSSFSGSISLYSHNLVDLHKGLIIGLSAMLGVAIGIKAIENTSLKNHRYALIIVYVLSLLVSVYKLVEPYLKGLE